ncbi:hypothetical protein E2562_036210 [Oryza meyeriana var. granulata]|uniref:Uncharacterized protein n=1 Tax=Oryza meyeriana var. granulata TaxID=110450 RepID=A0A6G1ET32_9ORYZ|nr:hypothetical protein E2562_036210 [Oryza meyeriana var. granulata]
MLAASSCSGKVANALLAHCRGRRGRCLPAAPPSRPLLACRLGRCSAAEVAEAHFEEYREAVKLKASKLPKKHPRCLADGNELLRFHGTTLSCTLGDTAGSSSLCVSDKCAVCRRIIRHGFSLNIAPNPLRFTALSV